MSAQKSRAIRPATAPIKILELGLVILNFCLGAWMLHKGWDNPAHVGWIPSGSTLMTGMIVCAWLIWRRRGTERSTVIPLMLTSQVAGFIEDILKWQANEMGKGFPMAHGSLAITLVALTIWDEINHRKEAGKDAVRESKIFNMEDSL